MKRVFSCLSGVLFLTFTFLMFMVTTVGGDNKNPSDNHQTKLIGVTESYTVGNGIAIDNLSNCCIVGSTTGNLEGQKLNGKQDAFVIKYDKNGNKRWTKLFGIAKKNTTGNSIAINSIGNCYITGDTTGNLEGQIKKGKTDAFIAKYDANGNKQWMKLLGVAESDTKGLDIVVDGVGNCYIVGYTTGNLDGQIKAGNWDVFIAKYDANGNKQWTKLLGAFESATYGSDIAIDAAGNCCIIGSANGNLDGQIKIGSYDAFIAKYDANGNKKWVKLLGSKYSFTYGEGIALDSAGNYYITGAIEGNLDGEELTGFRDAFIVKYDANGNKQWTKLLGVAENTTYGSDVIINSTGSCYITGWTTGNLEGQKLTGYIDGFIAKYDENGNKQGMEKLFGAPESSTYGSDIAINSSGDFCITGWTNGNLDGQKLNGIRDAFIISKVNQ